MCLNLCQRPVRCGWDQVLPGFFFFDQCFHGAFNTGIIHPALNSIEYPPVVLKNQYLHACSKQRLMKTPTVVALPHGKPGSGCGSTGIGDRK